MNGTAQQHLGQYDIDVEPKPIKQLRQPPSTISIVGDVEKFISNPRSELGWGVDNDELPDISGYAWKPEDEYHGLATVPLWRNSSPGRINNDKDNPEEIPGKARLLISGHEDAISPDQFLRGHALTELDLPEYYTRIESIDPVLRWSVDGTTHLPGRFLKRCIRLANGKGRIDTGQTHAVLTDTGDVVVTGPRGAFIVPAWTIDKELPQPPDDVVHNIAGFEISEEHSKHRVALRRYLTLLKESPYPGPKEYVGLQQPDGSYGSISHRFLTADDSVIDLTENQLEIIRGQTTSGSKIDGVSTREYDETLFTAVVDDLPGSIGAEITLTRQKSHTDRNQLTGVVTGYHTEWKVVEQLKGFRGRTEPTELQHWLRIGILEPDGQVSLEKRQVASFDLG